MALKAVSVHRERSSLKIFIIALVVCVIDVTQTEGAKLTISWGDWSAWSACCGTLHTNRTVRIRYPATRMGVPFQCDIDDTQCIQISECVCENNTKAEDETTSEGNQLPVEKHGRSKKRHQALFSHIRRSKRGISGYDGINGGNYGFNNYNYQGRPSSHRAPTFDRNQRIPPPGYQYNVRQYNAYGQHSGNTYHDEDNSRTAGQYENFDNYDFDYGQQEYYQHNENGDTNQMINNYYHQYNNHHLNGNPSQLVGMNGYHSNGGNIERGETHHFFGARTEAKGYKKHPHQTNYDEYYYQYLQTAGDGSTVDAINTYGGGLTEFDKELEVLPPRTVERLQSSQEQILEEIKTLNLRLQESKDVIAQFTNEITHLEETALVKSQKMF